MYVRMYVRIYACVCVYVCMYLCTYVPILYWLRSNNLQVLQAKTPVGTLLPFIVDGGITFAEVALIAMKVVIICCSLNIMLYIRACMYA